MRRVIPPDMSWLAEARAGDADALGAGLDACRPALTAWLGCRVRQGPLTGRDPEHLVSDGFSKALARFSQFRGRSWGEWYNWLRTICDRTYVDEQRAQGRKPPIHNFVDLFLDENLSGPRILDKARSVSSEMYRRELLERIKAAIPDLPKAERLTFALHFVDDLALEEIALLVGKSFDAVRMARDRAVERIKSSLGFGHGTA